MSETYSSAPFIAYDGADENGVRAEVKVVMGFGDVFSIEPSKAGKANKVSFQVSNTEYLPSGWSQVDTPVMDLIQKAQEAGEPIHFVIETRRQAKIDRTEPIADLSTLARAQKSIHKSLAAVKMEGDTEWTCSQNMVTDMDEYPNTSASGIYSARNMPKEDKVAVVPDSVSVSAPKVLPESVPLSLLFFVNEWDRNHNDDTLKVGEKKRSVVAKVLLHAANELQVGISDGVLELPDLSAETHSLAREIVLEVVREFYPLSSDVVSSKESLVGWKNNVVKKGLAIWKWGRNEVENS